MKSPPSKSRRSHGDGSIDQRSENVHRLRYRVNSKRFTKTFHGTLGEARKELRALLRAGDTGEHVAPDRITVSQWIDQWIAAGAPGRKKKKPGQRALERYEQLLRLHVKPVLGARPLQKLQATEVDALYAKFEKEAQIAPRTQHHVHTVFSACLSTAERKGLVVATPMKRVEQVPSPGESDHGIALDETELATLVAGFKTTAMYVPVAVDAATGLRRNELLALRWTDLNVTDRTLRVERALEVTKKVRCAHQGPQNQTWVSDYCT